SVQDSAVGSSRIVSFPRRRARSRRGITRATRRFADPSPRCEAPRPRAHARPRGLTPFMSAFSDCEALKVSNPPRCDRYVHASDRVTNLLGRRDIAHTLMMYTPGGRDSGERNTPMT